MPEQGRGNPKRKRRSTWIKSNMKGAEVQIVVSARPSACLTSSCQAPSVVAPCVREGEGKPEEVEEEHIEQAVHQNKVVEERGLRRPSPPKPRRQKRGT